MVIDCSKWFQFEVLSCYWKQGISSRNLLYIRHWYKHRLDSPLSWNGDKFINERERTHLQLRETAKQQKEQTWPRKLKDDPKGTDTLRANYTFYSSYMVGQLHTLLGYTVSPFVCWPQNMIHLPAWSLLFYLKASRDMEILLPTMWLQKSPPPPHHPFSNFP